MKKNVIILLIFFPFFLFSQEVCSDYDACNYAYEGDCQYPALYYDCNNNCINDMDNDNICDELEILGCTDNSILDGNPMACNFDPLATEDDGSCLYPGLIFDCDGMTCLNDTDGDGVCDENEILGCANENAFNYNSLATEDDGSCWYPVFGCLNPLSGNYNPYADLDDGSCVFSPWDFNSTDCNMTILIPDDANLVIDDYNLEFGDWIGAFYKDENNQLVCGGSVMWKEETTSIAIWGAESGLDNGFQNNEEITWKVFQNESENILIPEFNFGANIYACNALGGLEELSIFNQEIYFPAGWTIFSSYITPIENDVEKIFEDIDDLIIVKDQNGDVFWPSLGINQIGAINFNEGYIVKMNYESSGNSLVLSGDLVPSDTEMMFNEGWSIISYLNREPAPVEDMMGSIEENLIIIKDEDGLIYWPEFGVNSMNNMYPGRGYQIKLNSGFLFSYNSVSSTRFSDFTNNLETTYFSNPKKTGENMTIGIPISSWAFVPSLGDEVAVFSSDGILVGKGMFNGKSMAISIWGDDFSTFEKDGIIFGEHFSLKLWDHKSNQEKNLKLEHWIEGSEMYSPNGISVIGRISIFSNPIHEKEIIQKFDLMGRCIENLKANQMSLILYNDGSVAKKIKNNYTN